MRLSRASKTTMIRNKMIFATGGRSTLQPFSPADPSNDLTARIAATTRTKPSTSPIFIKIRKPVITHNGYRTEVQRVSFVGCTGVRVVVLVCETYKTYTLYLRRELRWHKRGHRVLLPFMESVFKVLSDHDHPFVMVGGYALPWMGVSVHIGYVLISHPLMIPCF